MVSRNTVVIFFLKRLALTSDKKKPEHNPRGASNQTLDASVFPTQRRDADKSLCHQYGFPGSTTNDLLLSLRQFECYDLKRIRQKINITKQIYYNQKTEKTLHTETFNAQLG